MANRFWHQSAIQPKRQFKFIAEVAGGNLIYPYLVRKVTRPELTMPEKQHKILGHEFQFPVGTQQWNVVNIEFMDIARDYLDDDQTEEEWAEWRKEYRKRVMKRYLDPNFKPGGRYSIYIKSEKL